MHSVICWKETKYEMYWLLAANLYMTCRESGVARIFLLGVHSFYWNVDDPFITHHPHYTGYPLALANSHPSPPSKNFLKNLTFRSPRRVLLQLTPPNKSPIFVLILGVHVHPLHPWLEKTNHHSTPLWHFLWFCHNCHGLLTYLIIRVNVCVSGARSDVKWQRVVAVHCQDLRCTCRLKHLQ